jgi:hypothetical protein
MIGFLKKLAVALLRSSGRPELVAMADWINMPVMPPSR